MKLWMFLKLILWITPEQADSRGTTELTMQCSKKIKLFFQKVLIFYEKRYIIHLTVDARRRCMGA